MAKSKVRKTTSRLGDHKQNPADSEPVGQVPRGKALAKHPEAAAGLSGGNPVSGNGQGTVDIVEKIKELVRLAQEQGYLTYGDINDALPQAAVTPEELDEVYIKLRNLEVEIVDQAEVDRILDKISAQGFQSLSDAERRLLQQIAKSTPPTL